MAEYPCPARLNRQRNGWATNWRADERLVLFLLDDSGAVTGAVRCGRSYSAAEARAIFAAEPWQPVRPGQLWPSQDTEHLASIPGMTASILEGMATPLSDCSTDPCW